MEMGTSWEDETVSLSGRKEDGLAAARLGAEEESEATKTPLSEADQSWGAETVVLDKKDAKLPGAVPSPGRREPRDRGGLLGAAAGATVALLVIGIAGQIGIGGDGKSRTPRRG
jgi:hypothetical protein